MSNSVPPLECLWLGWGIRTIYSRPRLMSSVHNSCNLYHIGSRLLSQRTQLLSHSMQHFFHLQSGKELESWQLCALKRKLWLLLSNYVKRGGEALLSNTLLSFSHHLATTYFIPLNSWTAFWLSLLKKNSFSSPPHAFCIYVTPGQKSNAGPNLCE